MISRSLKKNKKSNYKKNKNQLQRSTACKLIKWWMKQKSLKIKRRNNNRLLRKKIKKKSLP